MKTKMTPMVSWSIWAGCLSLVMAAVTWKQLIAGFAADETGMSYVITALFAAGLVVSYLSAKSLHNEWGILAAIIKTKTIPKSSNSTGIASVFKKLDNIKEKGETVDIHAAIDTYHSKHNSRVRVVSIAAGLVISMGLLGTVVGLIMSISGLGSMVENIGLSKNGMLDAMRLTFAGMGTAFYTTFFGALGGLILRAVAVSQLNSLSELCSEAAEYADQNLIAKMENKEEALNQQLSKVIASFENMQNEVDALTGRISESIQETLGKFGESIASVGDHAMETTKDAVSDMTEQFGEIGTTVKDSFGSFSEIIEKSGEEVQGAVTTVSEGIVKSGDELHESFSGMNDTLAKAGEDVTDSFANLNGTIGESGEKVSKSFEGLGGSVQQASDTVSDSLADFKLAVDGTTIELNEAVGELHTAISQATGEMVTMAKAKLDTDATQIAGHLSVAADSIQQFLSQKTVSSEDNEENQKVA